MTSELTPSDPSAAAAADPEGPDGRVLGQLHERAAAGAALHSGRAAGGATPPTRGRRASQTRTVPLTARRRTLTGEIGQALTS